MPKYVINVKLKSPHVTSKHASAFVKCHITWVALTLMACVNIVSRVYTHVPNVMSPWQHKGESIKKNHRHP